MQLGPLNLFKVRNFEPTEVLVGYDEKTALHDREGTI